MAKGATSRRGIQAGGEPRPLRTGRRVLARGQGKRGRTAAPGPEDTAGTTAGIRGAQAVWRSRTTSWESPTGSGVATAGTLAPGAPGSRAAARPLDSAQAGAGTREGFLGGQQRTLQLDRAPHFASRRQENLSSAARRKAANILFHHSYFLK